MHHIAQCINLNRMASRKWQTNKQIAVSNFLGINVMVVHLNDTTPPWLAYIGQPDEDLSDLTGQLRSHPQSALESLGYFPSYSDEMPISNTFPGVKISRKRC